jgi:N-acyl-D-aspartate/D-glutamate deacylase
MDIWDFYAHMVLDSNRNARVLIHKYSGDENDEAALRAVLSHRLCTIETDTFVTRKGHQNPASYGTFPRVLSTYVDEGLFSFEQAVHKMTGAAADRLGWTDRGFLKEGCAADLVILDAPTLRDKATFDDPTAYPAGIESVFVNGRHVLSDGHYEPDAHAGVVLRA